MDTPLKWLKSGFNLAYPHLSLGEKFSHLGLYKLNCGLDIGECLQSLN